jgi:hypothetical protein
MVEEGTLTALPEFAWAPWVLSVLFARAEKVSYALTGEEIGRNSFETEELSEVSDSW